MQIAFDDAPSGKAEAYTIDLTDGLTLYWKKSDLTISLPYAMNYKNAINFIWGWLEDVDYKLYDKSRQYGDVMYKKGFDIRSTQSKYTFVKIKPVYIEYHK
jgi:hypothetical protein